MKFRVAILVLLGSAALVAAAEEAATGEAKAVGIGFELLADVAAVAPGRPFRAGVRMVTEPGYHTYWKAPGIVGFPTAIEWELPDGFTAGELQWPAPEPVMMLDYKAHGYGGETLLFVEITPPPEFSEGASVNLAAKVSWMACARGCFPGHLGLAIDLPVCAVSAEATASASAVHFAAAADSVPRDLALAELNGASVDGELQIRFALPAEAVDGADEISFIPEVNLHDPNVPHRVESDAAGNTVVILPVMEHARGSVPEVLVGLLHHPRGWQQLGGNRFGRVTVTIAPPTE